MRKIGFGGSCHWCTEAIFSSLKGVSEVQQGWIASDVDGYSFSEAVIVVFDQKIISLQTLIAIHLATHSCTADHRLRKRYRSAVYTFMADHESAALETLQTLQQEYQEPIITSVLPFKRFRLNKQEYLDYYYNNPHRPFCQNIINPKLRLLMQQFAKEVDTGKLKRL